MSELMSCMMGLIYTSLDRLHIAGWQGRGFSSLGELVLLQSTIVHNFKGVRVLLDLHRLSRLRTLDFRRCKFKDLSGLCNCDHFGEAEDQGL